MTRRLAHRVFVCTSIVLLGFEARWLYEAVTRQPLTREIRGDQRIVVGEFGDRVPISQLFRMDGDDLKAISIQLASDRPAALRISCELRQAYDESSDRDTELHVWMQKLDSVSGLDWHRLEFPTIPDSNRHLYRLRLQLLDVRDAGARPGMKALFPSVGAPRVVIAASADNVREGGALWIGDARQVGSLFLRAHGDAEPAFAGFRSTLVPKLPPPLRSWPALAGIVLTYHWALLTYAHAMLVGDVE